MDEMHIRFGALPETGRSHNQETDQPEAGVSVYRAWWESDDRTIVSIELASHAAYAGGNIGGLFDRPVYIITGDLLDARGGDGEPLMVNCRAELVGQVEVVNYTIEDES
jgi:hypothetical protein